MFSVLRNNPWLVRIAGLFLALGATKIYLLNQRIFIWSIFIIILLCVFRNLRHMVLFTYALVILQYYFTREHFQAYQEVKFFDEITLAVLLFLLLLDKAIKREPLRFSFLTFHLIALALYGVLNIAATDTGILSGIMTLRGILLFGLLYFAVINLDWTTADLKLWRTVFPIVIIVQFALGLDQLHADPMDLDIVRGTFGYYSANLLSLLMVIFAVYFIGEFIGIGEDDGGRKTVFVIVLIMTLVLMIIGHGRFSYYLLPVVLLTIFYRSIISRRFLTLIAGGTVVFLIVAQLAFVGAHRKMYRYLSLPHIMNTELTASFGSGRFLYYRLAWRDLQGLAQTPLLGFGLGSYSSFTARNMQSRMHVMNDDYFLQSERGMDSDIDPQWIAIATEWGIFGVILFAGGFGVLSLIRLKSPARHGPQRFLPFNYAAMAAIMCYFAGGFVYMVWEIQYIAVHFFLFNAFADVEWKQYRNGTGTDNPTL